MSSSSDEDDRGANNPDARTTTTMTTTTTTTTALSSEMRRARDYVTLVKSALSHKSAKYRNFLLIRGVPPRLLISSALVLCHGKDIV